jgi:hypothetical protein
MTGTQTTSVLPYLIALAPIAVALLSCWALKRIERRTYEIHGVSSQERNPYGDVLQASREGFGSDVSSQRIEPFEEEMLQYASQVKQSATETPWALDLFSGYCAANARRLAEMGFTAFAVDFSPADESLASVVGRPLVGGGMLRYVQEDVSKIDLSFLSCKLDLVTAMRSLHFLRYNDARTLVVALASRLKPGAEMFFTIGAVDCKVGGGYKHAHLPVEERWHPLEPELGGPIHVTEPLCLYKKEDIESLFANLGGRLISLGQDEFGLFTVRFKKN